jgi:hypothetical protein
MLSRFGLLFCLMGGLLGVWGWYESKLASGATEQPEIISLSDLIARGSDGNPNIILTDYRLSKNFVYEEEENSKSWKLVWVPVMPIEQAPANDSEPTVVKAVLVSERVKNQSDVESILAKPQMPAMMTNRIMSLKPAQRKLLSNRYPNTNFDTCLILVEGRTLASPLKRFAIYSGSGLLILVGLGIQFRGKFRWGMTA